MLGANGTRPQAASGCEASVHSVIPDVGFTMLKNTQMIQGMYIHHRPSRRKLADLSVIQRLTNNVVVLSPGENTRLGVSVRILLLASFAL